jgi:hypothetical protein
VGTGKILDITAVQANDAVAFSNFRDVVLSVRQDFRRLSTQAISTAEDVV